MKKSDQLRDAMRDAGNDGITTEDVKRIAGSRGAISNMIKTGEVTQRVVDKVRRFSLNPKYVPARQSKIERALPIKRKKAGKRAKKARGHKRASKGPRSFKAVADKFIKLPGEANNFTRYDHARLEALTIANLIASADNLARTIGEQVDGLDKNPVLTAAIEQQKRATEIARAVGADCPF